MADVPLTQIKRNKSSFITKFASGTVVVGAGATGTYVTITPPAGEKAKLTAIASAGVQHTNLTTISVGGVDVATNLNLEQAGATVPSTGTLKIAFGTPSQEPITGDIDEVIEIKTDVATSQGTQYTYQFGE